MNKIKYTKAHEIEKAHYLEEGNIDDIEGSCPEEQPYRLRDDGRNPDGTGESYGERNA